MKKQLISLIAMLLPMLASAQDAVEIDGIWYNIISKSKGAEVTYNQNKYSGDVVIPESVRYNDADYSVTSIGSSAFNGCSGLTSVTIPGSVSSIGKNAFNKCSRLTAVYISNLEAWCKIVFSGSYSNPLYSAHHLFLNGKEIKDLVIPNSVKSIGDYAFASCSGLTSVTIPGSVTSIGDYAFRECDGLTSITIPGSVISIGDGTFYACRSLRSIMVDGSNPNYKSEDGVMFSKDRTTLIAYPMDKILNTYTIPNGVTSIGNGAFAGCYHLTSVIIPGSVTTIDNYAFARCSGLTSITIPGSVTTIGNYAFENCFSMTSITIADGVTSIGDQAFIRCEGLTSVTIPNSVTSIGGYAFHRTGWYNSQSDGILYLDNWLLGYKGEAPTGEITIADDTKGIAGSAFKYCSGLTSVTIPNGVTSIGVGAFWDCYGLTDVYCHAESVPTTESNAFENSIMENATLHVPVGSVEAYKAASPWNQFKAIVAIGSAETSEGDANGDGEIDVADIDFVIEHIGEPIDDTNKASDVNGDGEINVADVDYIIERIK